MKAAALELLAVLLSFAGTANACSCAPVSDTGEALQNASQVFAGEVISAADGCPGDKAVLDGVPCYRMEVKVSKRWKGPDEAKKVVYTRGADEAGCALRIPEGQSFIFFTYLYQGDEMISLCGSTMRIERSGPWANVEQVEKMFRELDDSVAAHKTRDELGKR